MTLQETLSQAMQQHQSGKLAEAEAIYRQILQQYPVYADALHLLGVLAHQTGHHDAGIELIRKAITVSPRESQYHVNLAIVFDTINRLEEAAAEFSKALELRPQDPQLYSNLSIALRKIGRLEESTAAARKLVAMLPNSADSYICLSAVLRQRREFDEALSCCRKALALAPQSAEAHNNLGYVLHGQGKLDEAIAAYGEAIRLKPDFAQAYANVALALAGRRRWKEAIAACHRALALRPDDAETMCTMAHFECSVGGFDRAIAACRQAIALRPELRRAHVNLAAALRDKREWDQAIDVCQSALAKWPDEATLYNAMAHALTGKECFEEAITAARKAAALQPGLPFVYNNLALALDKTGRHEEAEVELRRAIAIDPEFAEAHNNLGNALKHQGKFAEGMDSFNTALRLWPDYPSAHWNIGLAILQQGDYETGWVEYEWRWQVRDFAMKQGFEGPLWKGERLDGKRILLHAEQGFGDIIQVARFIPRVAQEGGQIVLACQPDLHRLFQFNWPDVICVDRTNCGIHCEVHCPVMSLPRVFGVTVRNIPGEPYLKGDAAAWRDRLPADSRLKVGFVWANRPTPPNRCPPPEMWSVLAPCKTAWMCSLQKQGVAAKPAGLEITDWTAELNDFANTAGLIAGLDLVISVDTAAAHLAGAMGKPVWLLLKHVPDWRWMNDRVDSPWYPTMRLFRQPSAGDWQTPLKAIGEELLKISGGNC